MQYFRDDRKISIWIGDENQTSLYLKDGSMGVSTKVYSSMDGNGWRFTPPMVKDADGNWQILEIATEKEQPQGLCKNNPSCRAYLEEKIGYSLDDVVFKEEVGSDGVTRVKAYNTNGEYLGSNAESGLTKEVTSSNSMPSEQLEYIKKRAEEMGGDGGLPTGMKHVEALEYNTNATSIGAIATANGSVLNTPVASRTPTNTASNYGSDIMQSLGNIVGAAASYFNDKVELKYGIKNTIPYLYAETKFDGTESDDERDKISDQVKTLNKALKGAKTVAEISASWQQWKNDN